MFPTPRPKSLNYLSFEICKIDQWMLIWSVASQLSTQLKRPSICWKVFQMTNPFWSTEFIFSHPGKWFTSQLKRFSKWLKMNDALHKKKNLIDWKNSAFWKNFKIDKKNKFHTWKAFCNLPKKWIQLLGKTFWLK